MEIKSKQNQKIVLFDIDYTLFDTESFREKLYKAIINALNSPSNKRLLTNEHLEEVKKETGSFDPELFATVLAKLLGGKSSESIIKNAIFDEKNFEGCLYPESKDVIGEISKYSRVGIFSKGNTLFQKAKLKVLKDLLDEEHIHITLDKHKSLPDVMKKYKEARIYIVDDAPDVLHGAKEIDSEVFTILVKKGPFAAKSDLVQNFAPDAIISNLTEVIPLVKGGNK